MVPLSCYWYLRLPKRLLQNVITAYVKLLTVTLINIILLCFYSIPAVIERGVRGVNSQTSGALEFMVFLAILLLLPISRKFYATPPQNVEE